MKESNMQNTNYLIRFIGCLALLLSSNTTFAQDSKNNDKNTSLQDPRVPSKYLPIEKKDVGDSTGYTFIDRASVKLHPYNNLILTYKRIINYSPALQQDQDGNKITYRSVVVDEYVNCDKKEFAKTLIQTYSNYFGEGELLSSNNEPKRWESTTLDSKERLNLSVICSLALND